MNPSLHALLHAVGLMPAVTNTTAAERACLARHAAGRRRLAEVGVFQGVTTRVLRSAMDPAGTLFAVDPFFRNRLGFCPYELIARQEVGRAKEPRGNVRWLAQTGADAARHPDLGADGGLDFAFLDGDHSWEGIRGDWEGFRPLLAPGGILALHDSDGASAGSGAARFTAEVIRRDAGFRVLEVVDTLTVLERRAAGEQ